MQFANDEFVINPLDDNTLEVKLCSVKGVCAGTISFDLAEIDIGTVGKHS